MCVSLDHADSVTECALCRAIITQIDKLLGNAKTDAEIEEVVKKVCKYLPAEKQNEVTIMKFITC